mgnify:CR=1 FL=1
MYCPSCGKEIGTDNRFCPFCGTAVTQEESGSPPEQVVATAAPPPPPAAVPPSPPGSAQPAAPLTPPPPPQGPMAPPPQETAAQPFAYAQPPGKKSVLPWILGIVGVAVVAAVVLVLVFVVFKGDGGKEDISAMERPVVEFYQALERQDAKMLVGTMEPGFVEQIRDELGKSYLDLLDEYFFAEFPKDLKITIREMETEKIGESRALVKIVDGTLTYTDEYGEKISEESDQEALEVVKVGGNWYISEKTLLALGFDMSGL